VAKEEALRANTVKRMLKELIEDDSVEKNQT
jgi:hypothetical protein